MAILDDGLTKEEREFMESRGETGLSELPTVESPPTQPEQVAETPVVTEPDDDGEDEPVADKTKQPPRRVPYRKFKDLEDKLSSYETELGTSRGRVVELEQTMARADERMRIINEALAAPTPEQQTEQEDDPQPNPEQDIFGYVKWQAREMNRLQERLSEQITGLSARHEERETEARQTAQEQALERRYQSEAGSYVAQNPKFADAYAYLMQMRDRQHQAMGVLSPADRQREIAQEERTIYRSAYDRNVSPYQRIYDIAVASGFNPDANPVTPVAPTTAPRALAAPAPPPPATPNVAAEIEAVQRGQQASMSLSQAGGAPVEDMSMERLANMSDRDFQRFMRSIEGDQEKLRKYLPGYTP